MTTYLILSHQPLPHIAAPLAPTTPLYDLAGRRVVRPLPGHIYLRAGRKFVAE